MANEDTLLRKHGSLRVQTGKHLLRTQKVSEQNQKHFLCPVQTQNLCPQQMLRMRANGETFVSTGKSHSRLLIRKVAFSGNLVFIEICLRSLCMDELNLVDILRIKNSSKRCFTYESSALKMKSRIDFFLISKSLISSTKTADIKTAIAPDHKAIRLFLQFENKKKGPGLWKFNNS